MFSERHNQKISYLYVFNTLNERVDNNDFKVVAQNGKSVSVTLNSKKTFPWGFNYFIALWRDDGYITKRQYVCTKTERWTSLQLPVNEVI